MTAVATPCPIVLALFGQNLAQIRLLVADLNDSHLTLAPMEGGNDVRWVLGHLAVSLDYGCSFLGCAPSTGEDWGKRFAPGTSGRTTDGPSLAELMRSVEALHAQLATGYAKADSGTLAKPHGVSFLENSAIQTVNDFLALLMTTHESFHIGQLSACRRAAGFKPIF